MHLKPIIDFGALVPSATNESRRAPQVNNTSRPNPTKLTIEFERRSAATKASAIAITAPGLAG